MKIIASTNKGFTLAELMVSIFIIALVSAVSIANYHSAKQTGELNVTAQKLASDIRMAQNYALGLSEFNGSVPAGGWGVNIAKSDNKYTIFVDSDNDGVFDTLAPNETYKIIYLPNGMTISSIRLEILGTFWSINTATNIIFIPPNPDINIECLRNNGSVLFLNLNYAEIEISDSNGHTKKILVNKFGLVDVED